MSSKIGRRNRTLDVWNTRLFTAMPVGDAEAPGMLFLDFKYKHNSQEVGGEVFRDLFIGINLRQSDYKKSKYNFPLDPDAFYVLIQGLRDAAESRSDCLFEIPYYNYSYYGKDKKSDKPEEQSKLVVGRDSDGVFIGLTNKQTDPAKFYVCPNGVYPVRWVKGDAVDNWANSRTYALAYANFWEKSISNIFENKWMDDDEYEQAKADAKKENQRRFSERQKENNNYKPKPQGDNPWSKAASPAPDLDEDIPWLS